MTLEDLAGVIQQDFARMATKEDLAPMATKADLGAIRADVASLREEMIFKFGTLETRIGLVKEELQEQIAGLKYAKEIDDLRACVATLEVKLGIRPSRRAP